MFKRVISESENTLIVLFVKSVCRSPKCFNENIRKERNLPNFREVGCKFYCHNQMYFHILLHQIAREFDI